MHIVELMLIESPPVDFSQIADFLYGDFRQRLFFQNLPKCFLNDFLGIADTEIIFHGSVPFFNTFTQSVYEMAGMETLTVHSQEILHSYFLPEARAGQAGTAPPHGGGGASQRNLQYAIRACFHVQ